MNSSIFSFKAWAMAIAVIAVFVGSEILCRLAYFGPHAITCPRCYSPRPITGKRWTVPDDDPMISFRLRPNMDDWFKGKPFRTNSAGFRTSEFPPEATDGGRGPTVAVLGRSISMGSGVAQDSVYSELLNTWLQELDPGAAVYNLSVGGYSFLQAIQSYRRWEERIRPDVVIFPVVLPDLDNPIDSVPPQLGDRSFQWLQVREYFGDSFAYRLIRYYAREWLVAMGLDHDWRQRWRQPTLQADGAPKGTVGTLDLLADFATYLRGRGVQVMILNIRRVNEDPMDVQRRGVLRWKAWAAHRDNVKFVDALLPLSGRMDRSDAIYPGDPHPKAKVHCYYAAVAFPKLVEMVMGKPGGTVEETLTARCGIYAPR